MLSGTSAHTVTDFPHPVRVLEHVWITLADGCRVAARIWLPEDAERVPVPAVLEYIPYRKNDGTALRDAPIHHYFAGHGYASVRVDMRGSGDSDGVLLDEYLPQEQLDGVEIVAWLAAQPWCTGRVGIIGKSWGGFNGLQIAAHDPPALAAVISVCSTDDRYSDDVHYMGGCLLAWDSLSWATSMFAINAQPPDPAVVGECWRDDWIARMAATPPYSVAWVSHQRRDEFWKQGSVCEDFAAMTCPVYMVGGWDDAYRDAIFRLLAGYPGESRALIGPWGHLYPESGAPGPAIGFLQECVRWWDRWLKDVDNGIEHEPKVRAWLQEPVAPAPWYPQREGRWVAERSWPAPGIESQRLALGAGTLGAPPSAELELTHLSPQAMVNDAGAWMGRGEPGDFPGDQRADDGAWLSFTSEPLDGRLELLGIPSLAVTVACDKPNALIAVRVCHVAPGGASTLVTRGVLNLTHRDGHEVPVPLVPGKRYAVEIPLSSVGYAIPRGDRLRVSVASAFWPAVWPSPEPVALTVVAGGESALMLPVRAPRDEPEVPAHFAQPEEGPAPAASHGVITHARVLTRDVLTGRVELVQDSAATPTALLADGLEYSSRDRDAWSIVEGDPLSAEIRCERTLTLARGEWRTRVEAVATMASNREAFLLTNALDAFEGDVRVASHHSSVSIPRDGV
jgi:putative CocE/NonD family hydrolase